MNSTRVNNIVKPHCANLSGVDKQSNVYIIGLGSVRRNLKAPSRVRSTANLTVFHQESLRKIANFQLENLVTRFSFGQYSSSSALCRDVHSGRLTLPEMPKVHIVNGKLHKTISFLLMNSSRTLSQLDRRSSQEIVWFGNRLHFLQIVLKLLPFFTCMNFLDWKDFPHLVRTGQFATRFQVFL